MNKSELRQQFLARRLAIAPEVARAAAEDVARLLATELAGGKKIIAGYVPMRGELDVTIALEALEGLGHKLALPDVRVRGKVLSFRMWNIHGTLMEGPHGTRIPHLRARPVTPEVLLVPLLAFDKNGGRLGYGGGYYDATLRALRAKKKNLRVIGVAYACQEAAALPRELHDEPLDMIVTEKGMM